MHKDLEQYFYKTYPLLFVDRDKPSSQSSMRWGLSCDKGWFALIDNLCASVEPIVRAWVGKNPEEDSHPRLFQIKEKLGVFCFYMVNLKKFDKETAEKVSDLINKAIDKSFSTCEVCSEPGMRRGGRWIKTLCDECSEIRNNKWKEEEEDDCSTDYGRPSTGRLFRADYESSG
jgi:hypothetical protein